MTLAKQPLPQDRGNALNIDVGGDIASADYIECVRSNKQAKIIPAPLLGAFTTPHVMFLLDCLNRTGT